MPPRPSISPALQGEGEAIGECARQPHRRGPALAIGTRRDDQLALFGQCQQVFAEKIVKAVIEAHAGYRRLDFPVFHPEGGEAGQSGQARGGYVGLIHVPEVTDVEAAPQRLEDLDGGQRSGAHEQGFRGFRRGAAIAAQAVFAGTAETGELPHQASALDQFDVLALRALVGEGRARRAADTLIKIDQRTQCRLAAGQLLQHTFLGMDAAGGEPVVTDIGKQFFQRRRREIGTVRPGTQLARRAAQVLQLQASRVHALEERLGIPGRPGEHRLDRPAGRVEQAPVEIAAARRMPAEGPAGIAESAEQRAIGVDTDQVATVRARGYLSDDLFGVRGERNGRRLAAPILGIEQQVGICRQVLQQVAQLLPCVRQATAVLLALAGAATLIHALGVWARS